MIRVCIHCKHIFGCYGDDGQKWACNTCQEHASCTIRAMPHPPAEKVTGGICDWCFESLKISRQNRQLPGCVSYP